MYQSTREEGSQRLKKQTTAIRNSEVLLPCLSMVWSLQVKMLWEKLKDMGGQRCLLLGTGIHRKSKRFHV
jgi:hypothetical protein